MPSLTFEGETHDELVRKVRRWLASVEGDDQQISAVEAVEKASELTKDALAVVAATSPAPIASSDIFKGLKKMGYDATDGTKRTASSGLNALAEVTESLKLKRPFNA